MEPAWAALVTADAVAEKLRSRTEVDEGTGTRRFTDQTRPTLAEVQAAAAGAAQAVEDDIGVPIPEAYWDAAARMAVYKLASEIPISEDDPTTEETAQSARYAALYRDGMAVLYRKVRPPTFLAI